MKNAAAFGVLASALAIQVVIAADEPPSAEYQATMRAAAAAMGLGSYGARPRDNVAMARALQKVFQDVETFWTQKNVPPAIDLAKTGRSAAQEMETAAASNNQDAVNAARQKVTAACAACHAAYVERLPDRTFSIRIPGPIGQVGIGAGVSGAGASLGGTGATMPGLVDGVFRPGAGITDPVPIARPNPQYTPNALLMRISGEVVVGCVVRPTGEWSDIRVVRSGDPVFGLDDSAVTAVQQWRFRPGTRNGEPVSVQVSIALQFSLR